MERSDVLDSFVEMKSREGSPASCVEIGMYGGERCCDG